MKKQVNPAAIIPTLRYENVEKSIEWLCRVLGFEQHLIVKDDNDSIVHVQLTFGSAMVMMGPTSDDNYGKLIQPPKAIEGFNTQAPYIVVERIDEHYKKAVEEGAEIVIEIKDEDYGGRGYTCRDTEGHLWNFGSYNPWTM